MWFKLNTTFTQSLGTLDSLSNSWSITRNLTNFSTTSTTTSVTKNGSYSATFTLNSGCTYSSHSVTMGGSTVTSGVSYSNGTLTVNISNVTGAVVITAVATGASSGGSGGGTSGSTIAVTWEQGAIDGNNGPNSTASMPNRARTQGYIKVNSSITISASGNAEFCPVYYNADKSFISSPNAYQTNTLIVDGSIYPLVRILIRDKSNTNATLSTDFGKNYITITGDGIEIPYDSGDESETISVTWEQDAIVGNDGSNGTSGMTSRLRTKNYIQVDSSITISCSGNAEFCPVYYNADKSFISSPNKYQTNTLTVSSSQYPLVRIMIRDKSNTNATLSTDFGKNYITITGDGIEIPY